MNRLQRLFRPPFTVPVEHRSNFFHLYMDVFWFGVLNGSTLVFLGVYATRSGATPQQMGLLIAVPAVVNLLITLPVGIWVRRFTTHKITFWSNAFTRIFYLLFAPLPLLFAPDQQVWAVIIITLLMSIPGTVVAVVGNAFFAEAVPAEMRGHVLGTRNALLAASTMVTSLISGQILVRMPFPSGYQVVFLIGFIGAALSLMHVYFVHLLPEAGIRLPVSATGGRKDLLRTEILRGPFGRVLIMLFLYNLSVFIGQPVFPLYQVRILFFTDQTISLGTGVFWVFHFLGSTQSGLISHRLGSQRMTAIGIALTAFSTILFVVSYYPAIYVVSNIIAGLGWSMIGGGVLNYLLERVPSNDRSPYLAWYNLAVNAASLCGALIGSQIASSLGLLGAMITVIAARLFAAAAIYRWGSTSRALEEVVSTS